jgi:hypothetical protein
MCARSGRAPPGKRARGPRAGSRAPKITQNGNGARIARMAAGAQGETRSWAPEAIGVVDRRRRSLAVVLGDPDHVVVAVRAGGAPSLLADDFVPQCLDQDRPVVVLYERREDHEFVLAVKSARFADMLTQGRA